MAYNGRYALADITENVATLKPNTGYRGEKPAAGLALKYYYGDLAALETLAARWHPAGDLWLRRGCYYPGDRQ